MVAEETTNTPPPDYPPLTVLPVLGDPTRFYVKGSVKGGGWWYECKLASESQDPSCECDGWHWRLDCSHMKAVREYLRKTDPCPVCWGAAVIEPDPAVVYVTDGRRDTEPVKRLCCDGQGTRAAWIEGGRCGTVRPAGMTEDELKELFR